MAVLPLTASRKERVLLFVFDGQKDLVQMCFHSEMCPVYDNMHQDKTCSICLRMVEKMWLMWNTLVAMLF